MNTHLGLDLLDQSRDAAGVVAIGRNEGDRLRRCLKSVCGLAKVVVYADSGSNDGSVAMSRELGAAVVELDSQTPFTAARARNEGFRKLLEIQSSIDYVFFIDGDCEVIGNWMEKAIRFLDYHPDIAVVCGRRRERSPEKSVYNMLCDFEWNDSPVGEIKSCGGDIVARVAAIQQVRGYRGDLVCGEEPEMCVRLRQAGWRIWRLDEDMTLHDAAIYSFSQWWKRMLRGGYSFAQSAALHGKPPERMCVRESRRAWIWGLGLPLAAFYLAFVVRWWVTLVFVAYPLQVIRLALLGRRSPRENWLRAVAFVLSKFPEMLGQIKFVLDRYRRIPSRLIEYK